MIFLGDLDLICSKVWIGLADYYVDQAFKFVSWAQGVMP